jgi:hypothetical protein
LTARTQKKQNWQESLGANEAKGFKAIKAGLRQGCQIFSLNDTKTVKKCTKNTKCAKWSSNIPKIRKLFQMVINYISIFSNPRPSKIYPIWELWFENKPSGTPGLRQIPSILSCDRTVKAIHGCGRIEKIKLSLMPHSQQKGLQLVPNKSREKNGHRASDPEKQGCQMVYFLTKNPNLGKFCRA